MELVVALLVGVVIIIGLVVQDIYLEIVHKLYIKKQKERNLQLFETAKIIRKNQKRIFLK